MSVSGGHWQAEVVDLIRYNIEHHFQGEGLEAAELDWYDTKAVDALGTFDVLVSCDCIYEPLYGESWKALLGQMIALSHANSRILVTVERRTNDGVDKFLELAVNKGLKYEIVHTVQLAQICEVYEIVRNSPEKL